MMEISVLQARAYSNPTAALRVNASARVVGAATAAPSASAAPPAATAAPASVGGASGTGASRSPAAAPTPTPAPAMRLNRSSSAAAAAAATARPPLVYVDNFTVAWNGTAGDFYYNVSNSSELDYDYQMTNGTIDDTSWSLCKEWTPAQHNLFQTANFFFAAAFLVPSTFKQSILLVRALLSLGCFLMTIWGGTEVCALDILLWNCVQVVLNCTHTALLAWKFLPPTLTLELTDLYIKVFKPLKVSKKHFKELVKEARVMTLEQGDIYAVEDVSPADERLSILLKGRLRVTCDDTHLHWVAPHQFVDSPEWEANREQSDDVFQVTITAEEDSVYLCWPRMRLERVLRHRPKLKVVLDSIIGKDITQKLYALNEHLMGLGDGRSGNSSSGRRRKETHPRSMSLDAVNTGTTGLVRSQAWRQRERSSLNGGGDGGSLDKFQRRSQQRFVPIVANQFPAVSPFVAAAAKTSAAIAAANAKTFQSNTPKPPPYPVAVSAPKPNIPPKPTGASAKPVSVSAKPDSPSAPKPVSASAKPVSASAPKSVSAPAKPVSASARTVSASVAKPVSPSAKLVNTSAKSASASAPKPVSSSTGAIPKKPMGGAIQKTLNGPRSSSLHGTSKAGPSTSRGSVGALRPQLTPPRQRAVGGAVKEVKFETTPSTSRR